MYKYFCKLSLGLKFGEFYFGFTGHNMPVIKGTPITKAFTCMKIYLYKHGNFVKDTYTSGYFVVWAISASHTD